jgi:hypothetical protein
MSKIVKISVSLDRELVTWLRERATTLGTSVSALLAEAAGMEQQKEARQRVSEMLGFPELSKAELEAAREEFSAAAGRAVRKPPSKARGAIRTVARRRKHA